MTIFIVVQLYVHIALEILNTLILPQLFDVSLGNWTTISIPNKTLLTSLNLT